MGNDLAARIATGANVLLHLLGKLGVLLAKQMDFRGMMTMPAVGFITFSMHHIIHHRGQLSSYIRPMGGHVPSIYGPSADDNPFAAKA